MGKFLQDFKEFALKGNVIDMAVGVIVGGAFGKIVTSLVNDILMPIITLATGGSGYENMKWVIKEGHPASAEGAAAVEEVAVNYGQFIMNIVDFVIIAFSIFVAIRLTIKFKQKWEKPEPEPEPEAPKASPEETLLSEIRDLIKQQNTEMAEVKISEIQVAQLQNKKADETQAKPEETSGPEDDVEEGGGIMPVPAV